MYRLCSRMCVSASLADAEIGREEGEKGRRNSRSHSDRFSLHGRRWSTQITKQAVYGAYPTSIDILHISMSTLSRPHRYIQNR
jgi:hypothetical protein